MDEQTTATVTAILAQYRTHWVLLCLLLILIDALYLGFRTLSHRATEPFGQFVVQRVGIVLLLVVIGLVDTLLPSLPLLYAASLFYSGVSIVHIVAQVRAEGVTDFPPGLEDRAAHLQQQGRSDPP